MGESRNRALMGRLRERALAVTHTEAAAFPFDHYDMLLAELLMVPGASKSMEALAAELEISKGALKQRLLDPVRCAWISLQLEQAVQSRLGMVDAAVFEAAIRTGDASRARYLREAYGKIQRQPQLHLHGHVDLSALSDQELVTYLKEKARAAGNREIIDTVAEVVESVEEKESPNVCDEEKPGTDA